MKRTLLTASLAILVMTLYGRVTVYAGGSDSTYSSLSSDTEITGTSPTTLLSSTISFSGTRSVLIVSSGRYFPYQVNGRAIVVITIDGSESYSSKAVIDWNTSTSAAQHSFECIAIATLSSGSHTFALKAYNDSSTSSAKFKVGAGSNLSVLTDPAPNSGTSSLSSDSSQVNVTSASYADGSPGPTVQMLTNSVSTSSSTPVVSLAAGNSYRDTASGDALWGIYLNGNCPSMDQALWTANDLLPGAELRAPMYSHAYNTVNGNATVSLEASEISLNPYENAVTYKVAATTRLISLWGMQVRGSAPQATNSCTLANYICVGSSLSPPWYQGDGTCNDIYTRREIASATVTIPQGHNGVVLFLAKTRFQPDGPDTGGNAFLYITIDDTDVGSVGVQQFNNGNTVSTRTAAASYLASGSNSLSVGNHTVRIYALGDGGFKHLASGKDLPLVWLD
jgi:hypothetical protein